MIICCDVCGTQYQLDKDEIPSSELGGVCSKCNSMVTVAAVDVSPSSVTRASSPPILHDPPAGSENTSVRDYLVEAERERREMTWHMAREIVKLSEALERQSGVLDRLAEQITAVRALQPGKAPGDTGRVTSVDSDQALGVDETVRDLQTALEAEREIVERLRRSKLEMERRAAEAEAAMEQRGQSLLDRILGRKHG